MNLISHDIFTLLKSKDFPYLADGEILTENDAVCAIFSNPMPASPLKNTYYQDGFQVLVRGESRGSQEAAWDCMADVHAFLLDLPENFCINDCAYKGVEMESNIGVLGRDENERFVMSCNYSVYRNPFPAFAVRLSQRKLFDISINSIAPPYQSLQVEERQFLDIAINKTA